MRDEILNWSFRFHSEHGKFLCSRSLLLKEFASAISAFSHGLEEKPKEVPEEDKKEEKKPKDDSPRPRPLHKTCSLFMRSIAPTISKAEIVAVS